MKELYVEGIATHNDPEPCIGVREDAGEAWDRGTCGLGIEPRNQHSEIAPIVIPNCTARGASIRKSRVASLSISALEPVSRSHTTSCCDTARKLSTIRD